MCTHPMNVIGVHLLCHAHGNEHMGTHDVVCDTFDVIAQDFSFHVGWKPLHMLPSTTFHSSRRQVDIVLTKDGICTLFNIIIADPTWMDLLRWSCAIQSFVVYEVTQVKKRSYHHWHPTNHFPPFSNWSVWMFRQTSWCVLTWLCYCHVELQRNKGPFFLFLVTFLLSWHVVSWRTVL
jgi:hypothetical protein